MFSPFPFDTTNVYSHSWENMGKTWNLGNATRCDRAGSWACPYGDLNWDVIHIWKFQTQIHRSIDSFQQSNAAWVLAILTLSTIFPLKSKKVQTRLALNGKADISTWIQTIDWFIVTFKFHISALVLSQTLLLWVCHLDGKYYILYLFSYCDSYFVYSTENGSLFHRRWVGMGCY